MGSGRHFLVVALTGLAGAVLLAPGGTASAAASGLQVARPGSVLSISDDGGTAVILRDDGYPNYFPPIWTPFVRDLVCATTTPLPTRPTTGSVTTQVSVSGLVPVVSATPNSRWVAFSTWVDYRRSEVLVYDRWTGAVEIVSRNSAGERADSDSREPVLSADGRYVVFSSAASNLGTGSGGGVYRRDRWTGTTVRIDVAPGGRMTDGTGRVAALSADGQTVAFTSDATNLVPGDTNGLPDLFVRGRDGTTRLVTIGLHGAGTDRFTELRAAVSADGRTVAFSSDATNLVAADTNGATDVFVRGGSSVVALSANGRYLAFNSTAPNLVAGDTNGLSDGFVRDLRRGTTRRVTLFPTETA